MCSVDLMSLHSGWDFPDMPVHCHEDNGIADSILCLYDEPSCIAGLEFPAFLQICHVSNHCLIIASVYLKVSLIGHALQSHGREDGVFRDF